MERNRGGRPRHPDVLTPAEWRALEALREGGTNAEIGARLGISADAVKYHISNMLGKLELRDRRALAAWRPEERRGLLPAWFAIPAAVGAIARPVAWVGIGTAVAAGVAATAVAAVVAVAVVLVVVAGDGEPPAVVRATLPTPEATSIPAPAPTVAASPVVVPTPTPATSPTGTPSPTPTVAPSPSPTPQPTQTPEPSGPVMRYDRFDPTGEASTPGSYTFLMSDGDGMRIVQTYEEMRTRSTVLRVHTVDADGVSHEAFYDTVKVGDVVEWREGNDCWARYVVTSTPSAASAPMFGVRWAAYAYSGCEGIVSTGGRGDFRWSPQSVRSPAIRVPVRYGPWLLVPHGWEGDIEGPIRYMGSPETIPEPPAEEISTTDITQARRISLWSEPTVPTAWTLRGVTQGNEPTLPYHGYVAGYANERGQLAVSILVAFMSWRDSYRIVVSDGAIVVHEATRIDGQPAVLVYSGMEGDVAPEVRIFDEETGIIYVVRGEAKSLWPDIEGMTAIARSLLPDAAERSGPVMRYGRFDPTGETSAPGSYAFLMPDGDGMRVVETYEQLRTEPRVLQVSVTDGAGKSQASFYSAVATDDVLEWRTADDCWVRYRITERLTGTSTIERYGVEPYSYAYGGCSGTVPGTLGTEFRWQPPNLSSGNVSGALMHGPVFVAEQSWGGTRPATVMDTPEPIAFPPTSMPDPDLGPEWSGSVGEGYGGLEGYYDYADLGWTLSVYIGRLHATPDLFHEVASTDRELVREYLLIDGRHPAALTYDVDVEPWSVTYLVIYDLATDVVYSFEAWAHLRDRPHDLIEIARKFMVIR